MYGFYEVKG